MFGSERWVLESSPVRRWFYRLYGSPRVADKIRAARVSGAFPSRVSQAAKVLDAGGGLGSYSVYMARRWPTATVVSIDSEERKTAQLAEICRRVGLDNVQPVCQDLLRLDCAGEFDLVLCVDVLEHICDDHLAMRQLAKALKRDGDLIVHVPQRSQTRHFGWSVPDFRLYGHVREGYEPRELVSALQELGLQVRRVEHTFGWFGSLAVDIDEGLARRKSLWMLALPVILLSAWLDGQIRNKSGRGLMVWATKSL